MFSAIRAYLVCQGVKYIQPYKAGELGSLMLDYKRLGQAARQEFTDLVKAFQSHHLDLEIHRTSQWMNQGQVLRPHFWAYLQGEGKLSQPMFALRLYGNPDDFGISLEVSFLERKRDEESLARQARVLNIPLVSSAYYLVQAGKETYPLPATEENRQLLQTQLVSGRVRKVLIKQNIPLHAATSLSQIIEELESAFQALWPYYQETRGN